MRKMPFVHWEFELWAEFMGTQYGEQDANFYWSIMGVELGLLYLHLHHAWNRIEFQIPSCAHPDPHSNYR